jgi:hypothetical protein
MKNVAPWLAVISIVSLLCIGVSSVDADDPVKKRSKAERPNIKTPASARVTGGFAINEITQQIDALVEANLDQKQEKRNPRISDEVFVRRIYLDAIGRIPTLEETRDFLNSKSKNKREVLIDQLLDSYGYVSHQFNYWADVLRVLSRSNKIYGQTYIDFIKDSLERNQPYDQFVKALLTAEGSMVDPDNGQVGYYLRDIDMPEDNMSNTVRVFLGTRLECAQCHDHPFDVWTQRDYFEMVAFTGGMKFQNNGVMQKLDRNERKQFGELRKQSPEEFARVRRMLRVIDTGVFGGGTGLAKLPEGFMGSDGEENEIITGKTMFDRQSLVDAQIPRPRDTKQRKRKKKGAQQFIPGAKDLNSRVAYANWMTSPENPRFAITIANRLWKQALGVGLVEPVDTIDDSTEASNEPLMEYLADAMVALKFDRKAFLKAIYNSRTYQSQASRGDINDVADYGFNGPVMRRMSAEQLWDSLMALTLPNIDQRSESAYRPQDEKRTRMIEAIAQDDDLSVDDIMQLAKTGSGKFKEEMKAEIRAKTKAAAKEISGTIKKLNKGIGKARRNGNVERVKDLMLQRAEAVTKIKSSDKFGKLKRASELPSPAPLGHFLREFGQSDRQQIENANTEPAVTQVLSMMNGFIDRRISKDQNTVLMTNVLKSNRRDVIDVIYLTMLSRRPTGRELRTWVADFNRAPIEAYNDLIWMLANSNEFIFVR